MTTSKKIPESTPDLHRFKFQVPGGDGRPVVEPTEGPYWITGFNDEGTALVEAYALSIDALTSSARWPNAVKITDQGVKKVEFTEALPKPDWWKG